MQRASYSEGGGYVEVMFGNDVIPLITRLSEKYTEYELQQIKDLNSIYALRIFEILMQWSSVGKTLQLQLKIYVLVWVSKSTNIKLWVILRVVS